MDVGESVGYQPIASFRRWSDEIRPRFDSGPIEMAIGRLAAVRTLAGTVDDELSMRRSLLLAALHTGAVEGVHPMNRGVTLTALDNVLDWRRFVEDSEGSDARQHVEAALRAYDLALDAARDDAMPISESWIRQVHEEACSAQTSVRVRTAVGDQVVPFERGRYKEDANHVLLTDGTVHQYAAPLDVVPEMGRLVAELRTTEYLRAHPVVQAAYAHHALTQIHPFQDGNGRVARVLASVPLLRSASLPFHLYEDQVAEYFAALALADAGAPATFVDFVSTRTEDLALLTADRLVAERPVGFLADFDDSVRQRAQITADRLQRAAEQAVAESVERLVLPNGVTILGGGPVRWGFPQGERDTSGRRTVYGDHPGISFTLSATAAIERAWFAWSVDFTLSAAFPFALWHNWMGDPLELRLTDVYPELRTNARLRVGAFVDRGLRDQLAALRASLDP